MGMLSAAHPTLPLPSYAKVTNLSNGRSIVVRINDRGPFVGTRIIDLSKRSADSLGFRHQGKSKVRVQYLGPAPLNDRGSHLAMMNDELENGASTRALIASAGGNTTESDEDSNPKKREKTRLAAYEGSPDVEGENESYVVQVASFRSLENALAARDILLDQGPVQVFEVGSQLFHLQMGPFRSRLMASKALESALEQGFPDAQISRVSMSEASARP